jgi:hypothetical protein
MLQITRQAKIEASATSILINMGKVILIIEDAAACLVRPLHRFTASPSVKTRLLEGYNDRSTTGGLKNSRG